MGTKARCQLENDAVVSFTGNRAVRHLNVSVSRVVLDDALVNRQEPAIGAVDHRDWLLVADGPDIVPSGWRSRMPDPRAAYFSASRNSWTAS